MAAIVIDLVAVFAVCVVICGCALLVARWRYQYLKSKGYSSPWVTLLLGMALFVAFFLGLWALARSHHDNDVPYVLLFMTVPLILGTAGIYVVARTLPARARRGGTRQVRFPFNAAGWILLGTSIVQLPLVYALVGSKGISASGKLAQAGIGASFFCFYLAKRSRAASAEDVLKDDPRAPVLYLRPFIAEEDYFAVLSNSEASKYSSYLGTKSGVTFEQ
jgi:hypothetical protein